MTLRRWNRPLAPLALVFALAGGLAPVSVLAQEPPPAEGTPGEESGSPYHGMIATSFLAGLTIFIVAKSARRN